ncbi:MAG: biopolymer transporter ExbD [Marinilabiliaceae bacterium]|jgi:biopolymer transport protein ExbD|nr:biopolymer transporter ExbD [Marinilabiliaceae bacterium]
MAKREVQEINAGSMADIAFLLLIFFLVTTTMDSDTGLLRQLPPIQDPNEQKDDDQQINERNILEVLVNKDDFIQVEGEVIQLGELRAITREFIDNPNEAADMPEMIDKQVPFFGIIRAHKNAVISLQNDLGTTYGVYLAVQNELLAARDELKNELALSTWGLEYDDLSEEQMKAVDDYYKVPISEAEPKKIGGN